MADLPEDAYRRVRNWIKGTAEAYREEMRPVSSLGLERFPGYIPQELLDRIQCIPVDVFPPLDSRSFGLEEGTLEAVDSRASLYFSGHYFIRRHSLGKDWVHFHSMVHAAQESILGRRAFLRAMYLGVMIDGVELHPLEQMADDLTEKYRDDPKPFPLVNVVSKEIHRLARMMDEIYDIMQAKEEESSDDFLQDPKS